MIYGWLFGGEHSSTLLEIYEVVAYDVLIISTNFKKLKL
jgi:hypothetical protein